MSTLDRAGYPKVRLPSTSLLVLTGLAFSHRSGTLGVFSVGEVRRDCKELRKPLSADGTALPERLWFRLGAEIAGLPRSEGDWKREFRIFRTRKSNQCGWTMAVQTNLIILSGTTTRRLTFCCQSSPGTDYTLWQHVEPSIFGTLLERALDPVERHKLGAHYTPRAYVERLVMPTIIEPLREQWDATYAAAVQLDEEGKRKEAVKLLRDFHDFSAPLFAIRQGSSFCF